MKDVEDMLDDLMEKMDSMFPYRDSYDFLPVTEMKRMIGQGEVMNELHNMIKKIKNEIRNQRKH